MRSPVSIQKELKSLTIALTMFRFGTAMIGVFIPLVILQTQNSLWLVPFFYLTYALVKLAINYPAMRFIQFKGAAFGLGIGFIATSFQVLAILGFSNTSSLIFLIIAAVLLAIGNAFNWNSQHSFISSNVHNSSKSSSIASIEIFGSIATTLAPIIGGIIGMLLGSTWLLMIGFGIVISTLYPLTYVHRLNIDRDKSNIRYSLRGAPARDLIANFCFNIETTISVMFWPLYLALSLKTFGSVGAISAVGSIGAMVATWLAGLRGDTGKDRSVLRLGAILISSVNILRIWSNTPISIAAITAGYQSSLAYMQNAWTSTYYYHAKRKGAQYIVSMEIACDFAYAFVWGLLFALSLNLGSLPQFFNAAFIVASIAVFGVLLISPQRKSI